MQTKPTGLELLTRTEKPGKFVEVRRRQTGRLKL